MRKISWAVFASLAGAMAFGQTPDSAVKFEVADVHASPKAQNQNFRSPAAANGRYTVRYATMLDLIRTAYGVEADKVLGGPSWLEMRKFDIIAKVPGNAKVDDWKPALQTLLADRFKLAIHRDTKPLPTYALTAGKKLQLKDAEGTEAPGCKTQSSIAPSTAPDSGGATIGSLNGTPLTMNSDVIVQFSCRNLSTPKLGEQIRSMLGTSLVQSPILDRTGLKGSYNFDLHITLQVATVLASGGLATNNIISEALEKQIGLKLERVDVPTPVILVDSVDEQPSGNPPGLAEAMPPIPPPAEFEVASVKLVDPSGPVAMGLRVQPGGRFVATGIPLTVLMSLAFSNVGYSRLTGLPTWMSSVRIDVNAKAPEGTEVSTSDTDTLAPMVLSLLKDRFGLKYHSEEQQVTSYTLMAAKPKLKQSDPKSRTYCKSGPAPAGAGVAGSLITCQNISMDEFADWLLGKASELTWPVLNGTDLAGRWDFSFTYSPLGAALRTALASGGVSASASGGTAVATDPIGGATLFDALEKQAGLKLTAQKRPQQMIVIDHLEQKPIEN
jgi:uncharacterized protein (TIGR03435 family)